MNIALASDENYVKFLTIAMVSILKTNRDVSFYILDNGIEEASKDKLRKLVASYNCSIKIISVDEIVPDIKVDNSFSFTSYLRLFLCNLTEIDKIIYMDCDCLVFDSLEELWNTDLEGNYVAGVLDPELNYYKTSIGLSVSSPYVNAGFLVMNLKLMRETNWIDKVLDFIRKFRGSVPHHDQGVINGLCKGKVKIISPKYNLQDVYYAYSYKDMKRKAGKCFSYSEEEYYGSREKPVFVHFTCGYYTRIWDRNTDHPLKDAYRKAIKDGGYNEEDILIDIPKSKYIVVMKNLYENYPFFVYLIFTKISYLMWLISTGRLIKSICGPKM